MQFANNVGPDHHVHVCNVILHSLRIFIHAFVAVQTDQRSSVCISDKQVPLIVNSLFSQYSFNKQHKMLLRTDNIIADQTAQMDGLISA